MSANHSFCLHKQMEIELQVERLYKLRESSIYGRSIAAAKHGIQCAQYSLQSCTNEYNNLLGVWSEKYLRSIKLLASCPEVIDVVLTYKMPQGGQNNGLN